MKRIFYLIAAVIGLSLTSSCGKSFFDQVLREGNWGLTRNEMVTSVNGKVIESLITDCDPFNPKTSMDTQLAVRMSSGNYYEFSTYTWDAARGAWALQFKDNYIVRDNVLFMVEGGREMELLLRQDPRLQGRSLRERNHDPLGRQGLPDLPAPFPKLLYG